MHCVAHVFDPHLPSDLDALELALAEQCAFLRELLLRRNVAENARGPQNVALRLAINLAEH